MQEEKSKAAMQAEYLAYAGATGKPEPISIKEVLAAFEQFKKSTHERLYRLEMKIIKYERIFTGIVDQEISDRLDLGPKGDEGCKQSNQQRESAERKWR